LALDLTVIVGSPADPMVVSTVALPMTDLRVAAGCAALDLDLGHRQSVMPGMPSTKPGGHASPVWIQDV
jgi:hypothetical protein